MLEMKLALKESQITVLKAVLRHFSIEKYWDSPRLP